MMINWFKTAVMSACVFVVSLGSVSAQQQSLSPIVVIGATARSAPEILHQALVQGRRIVGLARSPERIEFSHENFTTVKGDVYDVDSIAAALTGNEVVISLIGPSYVPGKEVTSVDLYSVGSANIITAMRRKGNTRLNRHQFRWDRDDPR